MLLAALLALAAPQAGRPPCAIAGAAPASLREIARDREAWVGRCVRMEGYSVGNFFYADVAGYYASRASNRVDRENDGWLGLYRASARVARGLERGTVVGTVSYCGHGRDSDAEPDPNVVVMFVGYCHYQGGLILLGARFRAAGRATFERQLGEAARARFGDLEPDSADRPVPAEVAGLADRFLAALRSGDGAALRAMTALWSERMPNDPAGERALLAYLLGEGGSPLAALRGMEGPPPRAYFREMASREDAADGISGDWHVCFCKSSDCAGRWPVGTLDSNASPDRPYVCLIAIHSQLRDEPPDLLAIERGGNGLVEPAR